MNKKVHYFTISKSSAPAIGTLKAGISDPSNIGGGKKIILLTCRSRAADSCASYVLKGLVEAFLEKLNPFSKFVRHNYMVMVVPTLSVDGTLLGNSDTDANGQVLDSALFGERLSAGQKHKSLEMAYLTRLISRHIQQQDQFVFYCHLESTFTESESCLKTSVRSDSSAELSRKMKFPILVSEGCNHTKFTNFRFEQLEGEQALQPQKNTQARSLHEYFTTNLGIQNSFSFSVPTVGPSTAPLEEEQYLSLGRCLFEAVAVYLCYSSLEEGKSMAADREICDIVHKRCENLDRIKVVREEYLQTAKELVVVPCAPGGVYSSECVFARWALETQDVIPPPAEVESVPSKRLFEGVLGEHLRKGLLLMVGNNKVPGMAEQAQMILNKGMGEIGLVEKIKDVSTLAVKHPETARVTLPDTKYPANPSEGNQRSWAHSFSKGRSNSVEEKSSSKRLEDMISKMVGTKQTRRETPVSEFLATGWDEMESRTHKDSNLITDFTSQQTSRSGPGSKKAIFRISNDTGALKRLIENQTNNCLSSETPSGYMGISEPHQHAALKSENFKLMNKAAPKPKMIPKPVSRIIIT